MTFLNMLGPAAIPTIICLVVGLLLLLIEMFTPGFGVAGVSGVLCMIAVVIMQFGWGNPRVATYILAIVLLILTLAIIVFVRSFQRGRLSRSFLVLNDSISAASSPDITTAKTDLIGKIGIALTPLRPAGIAQIDGQRLDVMTAGAFIEKDTTVEVVNAEGMHILVKQFEKES
ncbi:MAG: NfeD family protein [Clostridia bacterium]